MAHQMRMRYHSWESTFDTPRAPGLAPWRGSDAFTLIELLVVLAILFTLIGLTCAAIQRSRLTAARLQCADKLRQAGLGIHNYHATRHVLPPGLEGTLRRSNYPFLSWNARILPYLEHESLWRRIDEAYRQDPNFLDVPPHTDRSTLVPSYVCPADSRALFERGSARASPAFTSYLGVEGTDQFKKDGLLFIDSRVRLEDVTDGTSRTLMVGERPPSADGILGWWYAGWGQAQDGSAEMVLGVREINIGHNGPDCPPGPYRFTIGTRNDQCDAFHFWSYHRGGANFLFADGSVRLVSYSADPIMRALATRAGGEVVDLPD
jgi:prepilin-type processing-associated H-X9-DG protein